MDIDVCLPSSLIRSSIHCPKIVVIFSDNAISDLLNELPEELANFANTSPGGTQNGARDPSMLQHDNTPQKHQHLSQLLASTSSGPPSMTNANRSSPQNQQQGPSPNSAVGGLGNNMNNLNNAVKSPLSNNLSSPPHGPVNKTGPTSTPHSLNNDIMTTGTFGIGTSSGNVTSSMLASMSMVSTLNSKPMTSQTMMSTAGHQNQMMNGPHIGMGPVGGGSRTVASPMNMIGNANLVNSMAAGQLGASQGLNHPGLNAQSALIKVGP